MNILAHPADISHHRFRLEQLEQMNCRYAFYYRRGDSPFFQANAERFASASIIKVPILLAWVYLERSGEVSRSEVCNLDSQPQVRGAGLSYLFQARQLPYADVLLMMMALSDNLCTNLTIERIGLERLNRIFREELGLQGTELQRKLMDFEARRRGLDNYTTATDVIHLYQLIYSLQPEERAWVESMLLPMSDHALLMRNNPADSIEFYSKDGGIPGVLHSWGYTRQCELFLLTNNVTNVPAVYEIFGALGELLKEKTDSRREE